MWRFLAKSLLQQACEELGYDYAVKWKGRGNPYNTAYCIPEIVELTVRENDCYLQASTDTNLYSVGQGKETLDLRYPNVSDGIRKFVKKAVECYRRCMAQQKDFEENFWPKLRNRVDDVWRPCNFNNLRLQCVSAYSEISVDLHPWFRPFRKSYTKLVLHCERTPGAKFEIEQMDKNGFGRAPKLFFSVEEWYHRPCHVPICYEAVLNVLNSLQKQTRQFDQMVDDFINGVHDYFHDDFDL